MCLAVIGLPVTETLKGSVAESARVMTGQTVFAPGSPFGPYVVIERIATGGMGEVYRARDGRLGRDVALKVLPSAYSAAPDLRAALEREARLVASLNHPHIATIYGFHEIDGVAALALELVEGETLAARLRRGRLSEGEAMRYAAQLADALGYAHRRGLVHRDVKPRNIVVTAKGAKLLDFGLAYLVRPAAASAAAAGDSSGELSPGGTPFYMSPEQSEGLELDHRSDIYAFGLVLCQMLTGFNPENVSGFSTRTLILGLLNQIASPPLRRVIERCLASNPEERWQDTRDLHHALVAVSEPNIGDPRSDGITAPRHGGRSTVAWPRGRVRRAAVAATIVALGAAAAAFLAGTRAVDVSPPVYQQITFRRGSVLSAQFAGGNTIVYSARWDDKPEEIWSMRPDNPESRSLGITNARLLGVSSQGEMAILTGERTVSVGIDQGGMLARLSLDATAPREVLAGVEDADWSPDGQSLAVARVHEGKARLEYPIGTVLYDSEGWINGVGVSPDNEYMAFVDHPLYYDDRGSVSVIRRTGGTASRALERMVGSDGPDVGAARRRNLVHRRRLRHHRLALRSGPLGPGAHGVALDQSDDDPRHRSQRARAVDRRPVSRPDRRDWSIERRRARTVVARWLRRDGSVGRRRHGVDQRSLGRSRHAFVRGLRPQDRRLSGDPNR